MTDEPRRDSTAPPGIRQDDAPARRPGQPGSQDEKEREPFGPGRMGSDTDLSEAGSAPAAREGPGDDPDQGPISD